MTHRVVGGTAGTIGRARPRSLAALESAYLAARDARDRLDVAQAPACPLTVGARGGGRGDGAARSARRSRRARPTRPAPSATDDARPSRRSAPASTPRSTTMASSPVHPEDPTTTWTIRRHGRRRSRPAARRSATGSRTASGRWPRTSPSMASLTRLQSSRASRGAGPRDRRRRLFLGSSRCGGGRRATTVAAARRTAPNPRLVARLGRRPLADRRQRTRRSGCRRRRRAWASTRWGRGATRSTIPARAPATRGRAVGLVVADRARRSARRPALPLDRVFEINRRSTRRWAPTSMPSGPVRHRAAPGTAAGRRRVHDLRGAAARRRRDLVARRADMLAEIATAGWTT